MSAIRRAPPVIALVGAFLILGEIAFFIAIGIDVRPADVIEACGAENRIAPEDTYDSLALGLVYPKLEMSLTFAAPAKIWSQRVHIAELRGTWLASIKDRCTRAYVRRWLAYYDREAVEALVSRAATSTSDTAREKRFADRMDLAARLGINAREVNH